MRGTIGAVQYDGTQALIVLLGPGLDNNADARAGRLDVTAGGVTVSLIRPRFGTTIELDQPPSPPFQLTDAQLASILTPLAPEPEPAPPTEQVGSATSFAEQDTVEAVTIAVIVSEIQVDPIEIIDQVSLTMQDFACILCSNTSTGSFSDVTFQGNVFNFTLFDSGTIDGDKVSFEVLSGSCSGDCSGSITLVGVEAFESAFSATVSSGLGNLKIVGVDTGTIEPGSLGVTIDNVISGNSTQFFQFVVDETAILKFEAGAAPGS